MRHRGFTVLEMVLSLGLTGMVVVGGAQLWQFSVQRVQVERTRALLGIQANDFMEAIRGDIENAMFCELRNVGGTSTLLCGLPGLSGDANADGKPESFSPDSVLPEATLVHEVGSFVWFRPSAGSGAWSRTSILSRYARPRDILPSVLSDALDPVFGGSTVPRWTAMESVTMAVDPLTRRVTITTTFSARAGDPSTRATSATGPQIVRIPVTRTFSWRNSR